MLLKNTLSKVSLFVLLLLLLFGFAVVPRVAAVDWDCGLLQDCTFANFNGDAGVGSGVWKTFITSGLARFSQVESEGWPSGPSARLAAEAAFNAGIYQRVSVTPGVGYTVSIPFAVISLDGKGWHDGDEVNRQVGIDPFGGTDPNSGAVKWSNDYFGKGRFNDDELQVSEYAKSNTITVFIRVINPYNGPHLDVYLDSPKLVVNSSMPPMTVAAPSTPTNPPAPTAPPATARPTSVPTEVALEPTDVPTAVPSDTPAPTATDAPTLTAEPTDTPSRVPTRARRTPTRTPTGAPESATDTRVLALSLIGVTTFGGIAIAVFLFALAFYYWRRGTGQAK